MIVLCLFWMFLIILSFSIPFWGLLFSSHLCLFQAILCCGNLATFVFFLRLTESFSGRFCLFVVVVFRAVLCLLNLSCHFPSFPETSLLALDFSHRNFVFCSELPQRKLEWLNVINRWSLILDIYFTCGCLCNYSVHAHVCVRRYVWVCVCVEVKEREGCGFLDSKREHFRQAK